MKIKKKDEKFLVAQLNDKNFDSMLLYIKNEKIKNRNENDDELPTKLTTHQEIKL